MTPPPVAPVAIADIDIDDAAFRITTETDSRALKESIRRVGLITPPLLLENRGGFRVIAGFRRIQACRELGVSSIDARICPATTPVVTLAFLAISDNRFRLPPFNPVEISRALGLLVMALPDPVELAEAAAHLNLPTNRQAMDKLLPLSRMASRIQAGVISGAISVASATELSEMPPETADRVSNLFSRLRFSVSKQREILTLLREISIRDGLPIPEILREAPVSRAMARPEEDGNQRSEAVRQHLRKRRFPKLTEAEARYEAMRKELTLPRGVAISPPPNFESGVHTLTFRFSSTHELENGLRRLTVLPQHPRFKNYLD